MWRRRQGGLDPARLVFIDESSAKTNMTRLRGRAQRGKRVRAAAPRGHWHTTTMISSIRYDGSSACMMIDGAVDTEIFGVYVREVLAPTLKPGDLVIMDNLAAHKSSAVQDTIEKRGAHVVFLPAYSPDLNPIEKMWSKVKERLRAWEARTAGDLLQALGQALRSVTAQNARAWFAHCGYNFI